MIEDIIIPINQIDSFTVAVRLHDQLFIIPILAIEEGEAELSLSGRIYTLSFLGGTLRAKAKLSGEIKSFSLLTGSLKSKAALSGRIFSHSLMTGALTLLNADALSGRIFSFTQLGGLLTAKAALSGRIYSLSHLGGTITAKSKLSGVIYSTSFLAGTLKSRDALSGGIFSRTLMTGALTLFTGGGYDADAEAYLDALGILDDSTVYYTGTAQEMIGSYIWAKVNQLFVDLKDAGLYTTMKAFYPMVGGTAARHKYNGADPRDLDAAYRLTFDGGWTHAGTGAKPDGSTGYANTYIAATTFGSVNSISLSFYSRTNVSEASVEIGGFDGSNDVFMCLYNSGTSGTRTSLNSPTRYNSNTQSNTQKLFTATRIDSGNISGYRDGAELDTQAIASDSFGTSAIFIGAGNSGGGVAAQFSTKECAFAAIHDGVSSTPAGTLNTIVSNFETNMLRNV